MMTEPLLITATMEEEIDPDSVDEWMRSFYDLSAHEELKVTDPETGEVVWSLDQAAEQPNASK